MTCLEMYMKKNPGVNPDEVIAGMCPNESGCIAIDDPDYCDTTGGSVCVKCWNRQAPGEDTATPTIKDSGTRLEFSTGAVRDIQKGKGRCDLLPLDVIVLVGGCWKQWQKDVFLLICKFQHTSDHGYLANALTCFGIHVFRDPQTMILDVSKHFEEGAEKYGEDNWKKGLPVKCYINSAVRHFLKWLRGDKDENHCSAFCWNLICAIWTCKNKPELNEYGQKVCPVCNTGIPGGENNCPHCRVFTGTPDFDPDSMMGEYEEENV